MGSHRRYGDANQHTRSIRRYKVVRHEISIGTRLFGREFGDRFLEILAAHGQDGWDLKQVIRMGGLQALLIFSREAS